MKKMEKDQMHSKFTFLSSRGWGLWDGFSWILRTVDETFFHVVYLTLFKWVLSYFKKKKIRYKTKCPKKKDSKIQNKSNTSTIVLLFDLLDSNWPA